LAETGALKHVKAGRIPQAIVRARSRWASLPGANTPQPQRSEQYVLAAYTSAGGTLA
jgi:muramidase (phage lysozyme)